MYAALWNLLPGPAWTRIVTLAVLAVVIVAVLFVWVFPAVEPMLPFDQITLEGQ